MENRNGMMKVLSPTKNEKSGKTYWVKCGAAYPNRDGSTNIYLDTLPVNGKLQIRELDDRDLQRMADGQNRSQVADAAPF